VTIRLAKNFYDRTGYILFAVSKDPGNMTPKARPID
jgi:hypothetical protein